ncbi:MAG: hypothetical protein ABW003_13680 [Microvirga sp.]
MNSYRVGAFALLLALSGCSQIVGEDLALSPADIDMGRHMPAQGVRYTATTAVERSALAPLAPMRPSGPAPVLLASADGVASADGISDAGPVMTVEDIGRPAPVKAQALTSGTATYGMTQAMSPLMDLANMADWSGYKVKRYLPPALALPIISIDEIRIALTSDIERYAPCRIAGACRGGTVAR